MSSRVYAGSGPVSAELVLSVPAGEFEAALEELRGLGQKVTADIVEGQGVTEEFVDLESRGRNLLAAEESLLALYDRAENVEDTLTVERELTQIRGQIEEVQGRIQYLERRTETSEVVLHLEPVLPAKPEGPWSPPPSHPGPGTPRSGSFGRRPRRRSPTLFSAGGSRPRSRSGYFCGAEAASCPAEAGRLPAFALNSLEPHRT